MARTSQSPEKAVISTLKSVRNKLEELADNVHEMPMLAHLEPKIEAAITAVKDIRREAEKVA